VRRDARLRRAARRGDRSIAAESGKRVEKLVEPLERRTRTDDLNARPNRELAGVDEDRSQADAVDVEEIAEIDEHARDRARLDGGVDRAADRDLASKTVAKRGASAREAHDQLLALRLKKDAHGVGPVEGEGGSRVRSGSQRERNCKDGARFGSSAGRGPTRALRGLELPSKARASLAVCTRDGQRVASKDGGRNPDAGGESSR